MVEQRARVLEAVTPVRRAAMANAVGSPQIARMLQQGHDILRQQVADVFAPELAAADAAAAGTGSSADELLDTLSAALAWPTWDTLRLWSHHSYEDSQRVLHRLARAVLQAEGHPV